MEFTSPCGGKKDPYSCREQIAHQRLEPLGHDRTSVRRERGRRYDLDGIQESRIEWRHRFLAPAVG
jgi:hypothetical protein